MSESLEAAVVVPISLVIISAFILLLPLAFFDCKNTSFNYLKLRNKAETEKIYMVLELENESIVKTNPCSLLKTLSLIDDEVVEIKDVVEDWG